MDADKKRAMFSEIFGEDLVDRIFGVRQETQELRLAPNKLFVRMYFMAHAPAEPQRWFAPVMPAEKPAKVWRSEALSDDTGHRVREERVGEQPQGGHWWLVNAKELNEWDAEAEKQRYLQWPAAWADEQLKRV